MLFSKRTHKYLARCREYKAEIAELRKDAWDRLHSSLDDWRARQESQLITEARDMNHRLHRENVNLESKLRRTEAALDKALGGE